MFKFILDRVYPDAPAPYSPREAVQRAIIEALVGHLYRLGYSVDEVRVPASLVTNETVRFVSSYGQFRVAPDLDAFGDNVITSALTGSNATTGNIASASVTADTVSTSSDQQLAAMMISVLMENSDIFAPISREPDKGLRRGMFAVLSKLRAEGVIQ